MNKFDFFSPLDYRYIDETLAAKAGKYFSENARIKYQAKVEVALAKALYKQGVCTKKAYEEIANAAEKITAEEVYAEEKKIKHDVRALVNVIRAKISDEAKPFVHFSATSYDIVDTASAARYKDAVIEFVIPELKELLDVWIEIALREKSTLQIGRTHGQHAEPITFGFAMAGYINRLGRAISSMDWCAKKLEGKFSGAVGCFNASSILVSNPEKLEKDIMDELGLCQPMHSTQIVEPEPMLDLLHSTSEAFAVLANFSDDMRHLQRTEISEIAESFEEEQVGSSTMPHKRNPINFENAKSLWKAFMPRIVTFHLDAISEHQRDLTNSASARFIPEFFLALIVTSKRLANVSKKMIVDKDSMTKNFEMSREKIVAEPLYILLAKYGHTNAHECVRKLTIESKKSGIGILEIAMKDPELHGFIKKFSKKEIEIIKNPKNYTGIAERKTEKICDYWKKRLK